MPRPRLLLIDDEPALADYLANAARECGFDPEVSATDEEFRARFLADRDYAAPVLIVSGFDRRVLESAIRLGEAHGLNMAGPLEKPVRFEKLQAELNRLRATLVA